MKARDIVPGWPRGRSCQPQFTFYGFDAFYWTIKSYLYIDFERRRDEARASLAYHAYQQTITDDYRAANSPNAPVAYFRKLVSIGETVTTIHRIPIRFRP